MTLQDKLRTVPAVDEVLSSLPPELSRFPRRLVVSEIRRVLETMRSDIRAGREPAAVTAAVADALRTMESPSLRPVINATGVILHTNLGRAPLGDWRPIPGYSNLEFDIRAGRRGKRDVHAAGLIERLLGRPGIVVNNNAAAIYLALNELASGGEVIVSRGELIEIGDGFRIPDIMHASGAILREVGTTNRTRIEDYQEAINDRTRLLLRVHPSNFRIQGFTAKPAIEELAGLAKERSLPLYEDLGSGCIVDMKSYGVDEPLAGDSLRAGVDLISFSGDKLLGGPQAGILAGRPDLIARLRRNPMFRALRVDKLIYQAIESTLHAYLLEHWERIPALAMIRQTAAQIKARADRFAARLSSLDVEVIEGRSVIGGGSTPEQSLPTWLIAIRSSDVAALERRLRLGDPPVIARIEDDRLLVDLRTVAEGEEDALAAALEQGRPSA
jgi:L-seryl-tRNA(Ser) seleniumtransferase